MIFKYFNSSFPDRYMTAIFLALIIWLPSFFSITHLMTKESFSVIPGVFELFHSYPLVFLPVSFILTFLSAVAVNQTLKEYRLIPMNSTLGIFIYIIFISAIPAFTTVNSMTYANLFLVFTLQGILKLSEVEHPERVVFNTSFLLGLASFFFPPLVYLMIVLWMALTMNRHMNVRNLTISMAGLILPYVFLFTWYFWNDVLADHWFEMTIRLTNVWLSTDLELELFDGIVLVATLFLILFAIFRKMGRSVESSISVRRNSLIILYFLAVSAMVALVFPGAPLSWMLLVPPATLVVSLGVYAVHHKWMNLFIILYLILIIADQYIHHFEDVKDQLFR